MFATALLAIAAGTSLLAGSSRAGASVGIAASLDEIARQSTSVALVTPLEARSEWQGRRIVTFHRLRVESVVSGSAPGTEVVVQTLGGRVGKIAQVVDGEPTFANGEQALVFLRGDAAGPLRVTLRAQGQFRVQGGDGNLRLVRPRQLGKLLRARPPSAATLTDAALTLDGASLAAGVDRIVAVWRRVHAR